MPVWINCRGIVIDDQQGNAEYLVGCLNETGNKRRADNITGLLGGPEFLAYLRSQREPISKGFFMHVGIDDFGAINSSRGADYGNYILKSVAGCMKVLVIVLPFSISTKVLSIRSLVFTADFALSAASLPI